MDHKIILQCRVCLDEFDEMSMFELFKEISDKRPPKTAAAKTNSCRPQHHADEEYENEGDDGDDQEDDRLDSQTNSPLLSSSTSQLKLYEKVQYCCGVRIRESPEMPTKICQKCFDMTRIWYSYRQMCLNSQVYLESLCKDRDATMHRRAHKESDYLEYLLDDLQTFRAAALSSNTELAVATRDATITTDTLVKYDDENNDGDQLAEYMYVEPHELDNEMNKFIQNIKKEVYDHDATADTGSDGDVDIDMKGFVDDTNDDDDVDYEPKHKISTRHCGKSTIKQRIRRRRRLRGELDDDNDGEMKVKTNSDREQKKRLANSSYMCATCGNVYTKRAAFTYHMSLHTNVRPHECEICEKRFRQMCELKNHMRRHTGEKPYKCSYCDRHFIDRSEKHRHERVHTNTRPYVCKVCGKDFMYSAILKNHSKVHSGEKNFNCLVCQKSFTLPHQLKAHLQTFTHKQKEAQLESDELSHQLQVANCQ